MREPLVQAGWQSDCSDTHMRDDTLTSTLSLPDTPVTADIIAFPGVAHDGERAKADAAVTRLLEKGDLRLVVIIGAEATALVDALERRSPSTRVLVIEPEAAAAKKLLARPQTKSGVAAGRLAVLAGPGYAGSADAFRFFPRGVLAPPVMLAPGASQRVAPAALAEAKSAIARILAGVRANDEARRQFAGRYLLNTLGNLSVIASEGDAGALFEAFAGMPAIVVGAGPSLDRNLEHLRTWQHRALIIAVDTACRPLLAAGIRPHLVAAVDPSPINAQHLLDLPDVRGIWFVAEGSVDGRIFPQFAQRAFTFKVSDHHPWPLLAANGTDRATLQAWGSVLTTAFDLAVRAGCNPIAFAGADLAYTRGLQYCRNTVYESRWRDFPTDEARAAHFKGYLESRPHVTEPDTHGQPTISTPPFLQFRDWIRARAQAAGREVINATGAGILHGNGIRQVASADLALPERPDHQRDVQQRLYTAWLRGTGASAERLQATANALAYGSAVPLQLWFDFGGDTATLPEITAAAKAAGEAAAAELITERYVSGLRDWYDKRVVSLEEARNVSHGHYDVASSRAASQQAHVLMDFLQRTHGAAGSGIRSTLTAAAALPDGLRVLDVGCGVGRHMVALAEAGIRVDGVDISPRMLDFARADARLAQSELFLGSGRDCGAAPDGAYDLVYSQLLFRYVASRRVRRDLLRAMARALRPGGVVVVEMRFFPELSAAAVAAPHEPWSSEWIGQAPAGHSHVHVTPDELHLVYEDFATFFRDVRLQVVDLLADLRHLPPHLFVSGAVDATLIPRMNARAD